jgi:putative ABC transport system permease protein
MIITLSAFMIIGIIISAFCSFIIREDKVLGLLKGTKKPRPEPKASVILAIICVGLLVVGYFLSITCTEATIPYRIIPVTVMVVAATYLLFSQLSVFIIKLLKRNRSLYMKKTTVLLVSNLLYRVKDNTRMFFLITITTTVALSAIGSVYAYWRDKEDQININFPQAFFFSNTYENKSKVALKVDFIENSLINEGIEYTKLSDEIMFVKPVADKDNVVVMKEEVYKKIAATLLLDSISFNENETIGFGSFVGNGKENIILDNFELQTVEKSNKRVLPTFYGDVYIVKDNVYKKIKGIKIYFGMLNAINFKDTLDICKSYYSNFEKDERNKLYNNLLKAYILESTKIAYGIILFSVIFIGLIFFVTTGSFLYNKCYMDVIEDKKKYKQLNKIGLTYSEIKKILNIEIGVLFLLPYIIAVIHFSFAISSLKYAFDIKITSPALQVIGIMLIVQIIYFFIIRNSYLIEIRKAL